MASQALILNYHHVGTPPPGFVRRRLWVTPSLLAFHIRVLRTLGYAFSTVSRVSSQRHSSAWRA
jgi:hypothetical protein